jgi:hypothetical protein
MYRHVLFLLVFFTACCFSFAETPQESELKTIERLLEQAEKQVKEKIAKNQLKSARREIEIFRKNIHQNTSNDLVLKLLSFQKRLRAHPQPEIVRQTQLQISKILASEKVFRSVVRKEFGMQILELSVPEGRFSFYIPDDVKGTDPFTYSVQVHPFGLTDPDRVENEKTLNRYRIEFVTRPLTISTTLQQVPVGSAPPVAEAVIRTLEGFEAIKAQLSFSTQSSSEQQTQTSPQTSSGLEIDAQPPREPVIDIDIPQLLYQLPTLNQAGRYLEIRGPFDGIAETTSLSINKNGAYILAESPRKMIAFNPRLTGWQEIRLTEQEKRVRCRYKNLDLRSWASVETLASGANAVFTIQLDAPFDLTSRLYVAVENKTPEIISIENGVFQYITVEPGMLNESRSLTLSRILTGMHPAPFRIDARLDTTNLFQTCNEPD